jgi:hypothetical protein
MKLSLGCGVDEKARAQRAATLGLADRREGATRAEDMLARTLRRTALASHCCVIVGEVGRLGRGSLALALLGPQMGN